MMQHSLFNLVMYKMSFVFLLLAKKRETFNKTLNYKIKNILNHKALKAKPQFLKSRTIDFEN